MPLSEHILCVPRVSDFDEEAKAIIHYNSPAECGVRSRDGSYAISFHGPQGERGAPLLHGNRLGNILKGDIEQAALP